MRRIADREDSYMGTLTHVASVVAATEKGATILLKDHMWITVREAIENEADERGETA